MAYSRNKNDRMPGYSKGYRALYDQFFNDSCETSWHGRISAQKQLAQNGQFGSLGVRGRRGVLRQFRVCDERADGGILLDERKFHS